jgi:hypothetical protein
MSEFSIDNIAGFAGVKFSFISPMEILPTEPFKNDLFKDGEISIAKIGAKANKEFSLGNQDKSVKFGLGGDAFSALGVYRNPTRLLNALGREGLQDPVADLMHLKIGPTENMLALRWGYGFSASVEGKVALGPPGLILKFGAEGETSGLSVVLHTVARDKSVAEAITETVTSWRHPRQVKSLGDLNEGTTIVYETMGKLGVSLGVQYGYDFSWAKEAIQIGALSGDLRLKIEMAIKAQFGFSATGCYALVMSREAAAETIRVQVYRLKKKNWSFAFDGAMTAQMKEIPFPDNLDDFIKGVFNLNGSQILKDFEAFLDPNKKLEDLISEKLVDYSRDLVKDVTGIDPIEFADEALDKFRDLIKKWHELPHEVSTLVYGFLQKAVPLDDLKKFLNDVVKFANDPSKIAETIVDALPENLFDSEIERWLTTVSGQGISSLLSNIDTERTKVVELAEKTLDLLDGEKVEDMLRKLQKWIDDKLQLDKITDIDADPWLKKRLADFLGEQDAVMAQLTKIRDAINKLRNASEEFYEKGYQAMLEKYKFEVHYAFQRATSRDALIDVTLNFENDQLDPADEKSPRKCLADMLDGNFSKVLTKKIDCVTINSAVFTHDIKRSTHLEVGLPYFKRFVDHVNEASTKGEVVEQDGDRLWVFSLSALDVVKKKKSLSKLSVEASFTESTELRTFTKESYKITHKFQYGKSSAKREYLNTRYGLAVDEYLRGALPSYSNYLSELDRHLDTHGLIGEDKFGNILTSLEVSLPSSIAVAWKSVPENPKDLFYQRMSQAVQRRLRQWIPVAYIQDEEDYEDTADIYPLLAYMALPQFALEIDERIFYWKYRDANTRAGVFETNCRTNLLTSVLPNVRKTTKDNSDYALTDKILDRIKESIFDDQKRFDLLCDFEEDLIRSIAKTAQLYHQFRLTPSGDPEAKLERLAQFGKEFTDTFNDDLGHIQYTPKGALRPLGLILVKDIAALLDPTVAGSGFTALLEVAVLKNDVDFDKARKSFFEGKWPKAEETFVQQRIIGVQT